MQKIAFWRSISFSYRFTFANLGRLFRTGGPVGVIAFAHPSLLLPAESQTGTAPQITAALAFDFLYIAGTVALSVAWFRVVMLDERRPWYSALRFGRRELRLLGNGILVCLAVGVPLAFLSYLVRLLLAPDVMPTAEMAGLMVLVLVNILIGWIPLSRLALAFPAIAVDAEGEVLERAWRLSRGNWSRLYFGSILCVIIFAPLRWAFGLVFALLFAMATLVLPDGSATLSEPYARGLQAVGAYALQLVEQGIFIAYYSGVYRRLVTVDASDGAPTRSQPQPAA